MASIGGLPNGSDGKPRETGGRDRSELRRRCGSICWKHQHHQCVVFQLADHTVVADAVPPQAVELAFERGAPLTRVVKRCHASFQAANQTVICPPVLSPYSNPVHTPAERWHDAGTLGLLCNGSIGPTGSGNGGQTTVLDNARDSDRREASPKKRYAAGRVNKVR